MTGPLVSLVLRANLRAELISESWKLALFVVLELVAAAVGSVFVIVGISGGMPLWLQRCTGSRRSDQIPKSENA
jgi:hypothetical protein